MGKVDLGSMQGKSSSWSLGCTGRKQLDDNKMFVKYLEMFSESLKAPRKLDEYFEEKGQPCEMPLS